MPLINISDSRIKYNGELPNNTYHQFYKNVYSQNGEDGLLEQLLNELKIETGTFCEFGASNGISSSNTRNLIETKGFTGLYIERDSNAYTQLVKNVSNFSGIQTYLGTVEYIDGSKNTLQNLIDNAKLPRDLDVLSIDIDSYDYHVWKSFSYNPKIVVIEINTYRDPLVTEINGIKQTEMNIDILETSCPPRIACGTSFLPTIKLGLEKGYIPVAFTGNITFIRKDLIDNIKYCVISDNPYDYLYLYSNLVLWDNDWYTCEILMFNTAVRNYYKEYNKYMIDLNWVKNHIETYGMELWKY